MVIGQTVHRTTLATPVCRPPGSFTPTPAPSTPPVAEEPGEVGSPGWDAVLDVMAELVAGDGDGGADLYRQLGRSLRGGQPGAVRSPRDAALVEAGREAAAAGSDVEPGALAPASSAAVAAVAARAGSPLGLVLTAYAPGVVRPEPDPITPTRGCPRAATCRERRVAGRCQRCGERRDG